MANTFTSVQYKEGMGDNPASVRRSTGELFLNHSLFFNMPFESRIWILLHELAHLKRDTANEHIADEQAFEWYVSRGYSLRRGVLALTKIMNNCNAEHRQRAKNQLIRCLRYDWEHNHYQPAFEYFKKLNAL